MYLSKSAGRLHTYYSNSDATNKCPCKRELLQWKHLFTCRACTLPSATAVLSPVSFDAQCRRGRLRGASASVPCRPRRPRVGHTDAVSVRLAVKEIVYFDVIRRSSVHLAGCCANTDKHIIRIQTTRQQPVCRKHVYSSRKGERHQRSRLYEYNRQQHPAVAVSQHSTMTTQPIVHTRFAERDKRRENSQK